MKVELKIDPEIKESYAVIFTCKIDDKINEAVACLEGLKREKNLTALNGEKMVILEPKDIYMIRIENGKTMIYTGDNNYLSGKRLYELMEQLGSQFVQISKSTAVNSMGIDYVEPYLNGMMCIKLKNGIDEYISRKYLAGFKTYLGIGEKK